MMTKPTANPSLSLIRFLLAILIALSAAGALYCGIKAYTRWRFLGEDTHRTVQQKAYEQAQKLNELLTAIIQEAERMALQISNEHDRATLEQRLKKLWDASPLIGSTGVAYAYRDDEKPFSIFITKKVVEGKAAFHTYQLEKYYDYRQASWYLTAMAGNPGWSDPLIDVVTNRSVVRYAIPLSQFHTAENKRTHNGVLFIDLSHRDLAEAMSTMTEALRGYSFILSDNDDLITYPIEEEVEEYKTLFNLSRLPGKQQLREVAKEVQKKRAGVTHYYDTLSQESLWVAFAPLSAAPWYLLLFSNEENIWFNPTLR